MRVVKKKEKEICVDEIKMDHIVMASDGATFYLLSCYFGYQWFFWGINKVKGLPFKSGRSSQVISHYVDYGYEVYAFETQKEFAEFLLERS